jgi:phosphotransferase family enzyme
MHTEPVSPRATDRSGQSDDACTQILRSVNRTHGTSYTLVGRLPGGYRSGAHLVRDRSGRDAVLKWSPDPSWARHVQRAAPLVAAARRAGWPTPAWLAVGTTDEGHLYQLQERVRGLSPERLTGPMARQALVIIDWQRGRAPDSEQCWSAYDRAVVYAGGSGPLDSIDEYSAAGHAFAGTVRAALAPYHQCTLPDSDLVHGDLSPDNILLDGDRLVAVIDVEAAGRGSRFHDVASLVAHGMLWDGDPDALGLLHAHARRHAEPGVFEISVAAAFITILGSHLSAHDRPDDADELFARATEAVLRLR